MARPSNFSDVQILDASKRLIDAGKKVTGYALTKELGGGNPNSLEAKYLELSQTVTHGPKLQALPSVIEGSINGAIANLSKTLVDVLTKTYGDLKADAEVTVDQIKELAQTEIEEIRTQLADAAENEQAEADRAAALETQLMAANKTIEALKVDVANRDGQLKALNDAKHGLEQSILELQSDKQRLEIENASLTKQVADAKTAMTAAKADAEAAIQKVKDEAKKEVAEAKDEAKKERGEKDTALLKATAAESAYKELKTSNDKATQELAEANKKLGQLENQLKTTAAKLDEKTKELDAIKAPVPAQEDVATKKH
ncbi:MAG: DNA-binding protein [Comamonas sp.]|nr:DNA-binding protein [Comamonas sp.]